MHLLFSLALVATVFIPLSLATNIAHQIHQYKNHFKGHANAQRLENARLTKAGAAVNDLIVNPSTLATNAIGFQLYTADTLPTTPAPSTGCANAMTATIACNATVQLMSFPFDANSLAAMCTTSCSSSMQSYRANVVSACNGIRFTGSNNATYPATLAIDYMSEPYFTQCRKDQSTGQFCSVVMAGFQPTNPSQGILGFPQNELCTSCTLGIMNTTLSNPTTFSNALYDTFQTALRECGSTWSSYNLSSAASAPLFSTSPPLGSTVTVDASCAIIGRNVTVASNSTCTVLSTQFSVSPQDILNNNPSLQPSDCVEGIAAQTKLCLPQTCTLYTVRANQTCDDVVSDVNSRGLAAGQNITTAQLESFNPSIQCSSLPVPVNDIICVTPHGGFATLGNDGGQAVPTPTPTAVVPPPGQTAPGTSSSCGRWYLVQPNNFCQQVALNNSITLTDFQTLNPELITFTPSGPFQINEDCTNLWANYYYCVAPFPPLSQISAAPTITLSANSTFGTLLSIPLATVTSTVPLTPLPSATGIPAPPNIANGTITNGCGYYYVVKSGDNCTSVEEFFDMSDSDFTTFNNDPQVPCPSLTVGTAVCVQVLNVTDTIPPIPSNAASGSGPNGCMQWYTIVSGDGCPSVEAKFGLSASQFFALNPEVKTDCTNLGLGQAYCVRGLGQPAGVPIPANVVSGTDTTNCTRYDTVISGDSCPAIESRNNVTDIIFRALNPEINSGCTNIQLGGAYCVQPVPGYQVAAGPPANVVAGTDTKDCAKYDTIISGDSCPAVEARNNISDTLFRILNPQINSGCTNIQLGGAYCVQAVPGFTSTATATSTTTAGGTLPTNIAAGSWTNCTTYYTTVSGDNCQAIDTKFTISLSDFLRWNPEISSTCNNLQLSEV
ncbi:hypothetical protein CVT24_004533 [Panaeolus cyanescens]|uniref:LysM domain-containing protein n=1 Tax=Panaeolus cyanescens TaxID=181874 RepID=A0A409YBW2_9AGAR|nr:hypothetical protein CVT24_004533 [Panaeolus cyanescens]